MTNSYRVAPRHVATRITCEARAWVVELPRSSRGSARLDERDDRRDRRAVLAEEAVRGARVAGVVARLAVGVDPPHARLAVRPGDELLRAARQREPADVAAVMDDERRRQPVG